MASTLLIALGLVAALIQVRGTPLQGGRVVGSASVVLERASGGDTPVLTFDTDRGRVRLLLDTGASSTMVNANLASRLNLDQEPLPAERFSMVGGGSDCRQGQPSKTRLPPMRLQGPAADGGERLEFGTSEAMVMEIGALPDGVDGVLGTPTLRQLPILIHPGRNRVSLGQAAVRGKDVPEGPPVLSLPLQWRHGVPILRVATVNGPVSALADTGAEGLFLSPELASRLHPLGPRSPVRLVGVCGEQKVHQQPFTGLRLQPDPGSWRPVAGASSGNQEVVRGIITKNSIFRQLEVEAIVGQELFRHRPQRWRLDLDPPRLELW